MLARSALRSVARPALRPVAGPSRVAAARFYSAEAEKKEAGAEDESTKKIAELQGKLEELNKEMQYLRADYQTMSRRVQEEKAKAGDFAIQKFARALLSTSDVLNTALKHVPTPIEEGSPLQQLANGVELTQKALLKTFEVHGVVPMGKLVGTEFDPNLHEATFQVPSAVAPKGPDGGEPAAGQIIEVSKEGWMIKTRVLRPAEVGIVQLE